MVFPFFSWGLLQWFSWWLLDISKEIIKELLLLICLIDLELQL
jgi:hypothetical protein